MPVQGLLASLSLNRNSPKQGSFVLVGGIRVDNSPSTSSLVSFAPDGSRAEFLSRRMKTEFVRSCRDLVSQCHARFAIDVSATERAMIGFGTADPAPETYAIYFDLMQALNAEDEAACRSHLERLAAPAIATPNLTYRRWGALTTDCAERFLRYVNIDPSTQLAFADVPEPDFSDACATADRTFEMFQRCAPEIAAEIRGLVNELIFVENAPDCVLRFDGATSVFSWGALFLNAAEHNSVVEMVDGLAHESAHAHLFGLSMGDPFVNNSPDEVHPSPLREDPRPLDGTFHATFVSARMHYAHSKLLAGHALTVAQRDEAAVARDLSVSAFRDGLAVIEAHADMTPLGASVMAEAVAYMHAA